MARAAASDVQRFAWPRVADEVMDAYEDAIATPAPQGALQRAAVRVGAAFGRPQAARAARGACRRSSRRPPRERRAGALAFARRGALAAISLGGAVLALLALQKIGLGNIASALLHSSPAFVLIGLAVMCGAMVMRAFSWHAILQAALPRARASGCPMRRRERSSAC